MNKQLLVRAMAKSAREPSRDLIGLLNALLRPNVVHNNKFKLIIDQYEITVYANDLPIGSHTTYPNAPLKIKWVQQYIKLFPGEKDTSKAAENDEKEVTVYIKEL